MIDLTEEQIERYSRHILLQDVGLEGQEKLLNAKVLIIGAGGLGSPVALLLSWLSSNSPTDFTNSQIF
jgi:molybdopterin-synthase adenylyltransferase